MKAWELLEQKGWTQGSYARDGNGRTVECLERACAFCLLGAVNAVSQRERLPEIVAALKLEQRHELVRWNDDPKRTREEVISLLKGLDI